MITQENHEMQLERRHESGTEEWYCPTCERRFLMNWEPKFKKIILEVGDEYAIHSGGKGGLRIGSVEIIQRDLETGEISEESLRPWIKALKNLGLDW